MKNLIKISMLLIFGSSFLFSVILKGNKNPDGSIPEGILPDGVYQDFTIKGYDNNKNSFTLEMKDNLLYKDNKLYTGYFITHFDNGNIGYEGNHKDGKKDGLIKGYYDNQQIGYEVNYKNGIKHGKHTMYYETGNLLEKGNFIEGKEEGEWVIVDSLGFINKGNYKNGKREGIWDWYIVDFETSLDTIKIEENFYEKGILKGKTEVRFTEGDKWMYVVTNYLHHDNGQIHLEEESIEGVKIKSTFYYNTGQKSSENFYTYVNGDKHTKWIKYYNHGVVQEEGNYINDKEEGKFLLYDKYGQLEGELIFKNGKIIKSND